ncbi:NAD-dependent epimerase/dehydratase family protein [Caulobacter hibisci]|uniref:NAD-dependent epimerase/dehydratase family protein n=1 Tax=Caulobacter hibisci TaxID=2035993 RepID=A0ABS0SRS1_9CAUL|nr:NAD-dependent epimerase/dehydratase family protein [Caulobacter hibisci]MBI1682307.1 NAD-dependent epimerase/dehydratase family protein [Caulobacter hibisci]
MTSIEPAAGGRAPTRLFLTGGSGYVGRNLIRRFVADGVQVVALARSPETIATVSGLGAEPFAGDLFDPALAQGMAGCQALVHAAADTDHGAGVQARLRRINVEGTRAVLAAARTAGVSRVVLISTESVLLDGAPLHDATEDQPYPRHPAGAYSRTKGEAERLALAQSEPGFEVVAVRPRFVWGRDDTTALPQLAGAVRSGAFAWIDGGRYATSTTHVANLCEGVVLALARGQGGQAYFVTDGEPVEFRTFATQLLATQGLTPPDKTVPGGVLRVIATIGDALAALSGGRITGPLSRQVYATSAVEVTLNIAKARATLGYELVVTRAQGLVELEGA